MRNSGKETTKWLGVRVIFLTSKHYLVKVQMLCDTFGHQSHVHFS